MKAKGILILCLLVFVSLGQTTGLFLEMGLAPPSGQYRTAVGLVDINVLGKGTAFGSELAAVDSKSLLGCYHETSYSKEIWAGLGLRAGYRKGLCYIITEERAGVTTGASFSVFWNWAELLATYTAVTYVKDSVVRSASSWHIGLAFSLLWSSNP